MIVISSNCEKDFECGFGGVERGSYLTANSVPFLFFLFFFFTLFFSLGFEMKLGCIWLLRKSQ